MKREWVYFDVDTIVGEFSALPEKDRAKLLALMDHFERVGRANPNPTMIDDYGDGIKRLRHMKPAYQGRALFFTTESTGDSEKLVVLTVFKKESQGVPGSILERARQRRKLYLTKEKP